MRIFLSLTILKEKNKNKMQKNKESNLNFFENRGDRNINIRPSIEIKCNIKGAEINWNRITDPILPKPAPIKSEKYNKFALSGKILKNKLKTNPAK